MEDIQPFDQKLYQRQMDRKGFVTCPKGDCQTSYLNMHGFQRHLVNCDGTPLKNRIGFKCKSCEAKFRTYITLKNHMKKSHPDIVQNEAKIEPLKSVTVPGKVEELNISQAKPEEIVVKIEPFESQTFLGRVDVGRVDVGKVDVGKADVGKVEDPLSKPGRITETEWKRNRKKWRKDIANNGYVLCPIGECKAALSSIRGNPIKSWKTVNIEMEGLNAFISKHT